MLSVNFVSRHISILEDNILLSSNFKEGKKQGLSNKCSKKICFSHPSFGCDVFCVWTPDALPCPIFFREFQDLACGVLNQCYTDKPELTDQILTRKRPRWRNLSCLEIAFKMKVYPFMSHEASKIPINRVWFGKISPNTSAVQVNMLIFIACTNILNSSKSLLFVQLFCSPIKT